MRKNLLSILIVFSMTFAAFAGDSAVFVDNGFSADGNYYIFGQYGKTDKTFCGWAEIYIVDVKANEYVDGCVYRIKPSAVTSDKSGKEVYETLFGKNFYSISKYNCSPAKPEQILYIREAESKSSTDEILFQDFTSSISKDKAFYKVKLVPKINGKGLETKSSFVIDVEKLDSKGNILAKQQLGSPSIVRRGVKDYKIERIVCDKSGKNLVVIVEKTCEDKTGTNIRYMIETAELNENFFANLAEEPAEIKENDVSEAEDSFIDAK